MRNSARESRRKHNVDFLFFITLLNPFTAKKGDSKSRKEKIHIFGALAWQNKTCARADKTPAGLRFSSTTLN
jgi:hypothetical protein